MIVGGHGRWVVHFQTRGRTIEAQRGGSYREALHIASDRAKWAPLGDGGRVLITTSSGTAPESGTCFYSPAAALNEWAASLHTVAVAIVEHHTL